MTRNRWIYFGVTVALSLLYYAVNATGLDFPAMLIILPVGCWVIWNINPDENQ